METPWIYTQNVFDNVTKDNALRMVIISGFHLNALKAQAGDAFYDGRITFYEPLHDALEEAYDSWVGGVTSQTGATQSVDDLLKELASDKANEWDVALQNVYGKKTDTYKGIIGNLHNKMQAGKKDERINAVNTFAQNMGADAALAALKTEVLAFYDSLVAARTAQQGKLSGTKIFSDALETARVNCADGQFADAGLLMNKFYTNRLMIDNFFDVANIRSHNQTEFTISVAAHSSKTILRHAFKAGDVLIINNTAESGDVQICITHSRGESCTTPAVTAPRDQTTTITVDDSFGDLVQNQYLTVTNNTDGDAHLVLTIN